MKIKFLPIFVSLLFLFLYSGCSESPTETCNDIDTSSVTVRKPNIYIYPSEKINLSVQITFPNGGNISESIPEYNTGWNVLVEPSGIINNKFEYLFYECKIPDLFQKEAGWIVEQSVTKAFFENNLEMYGFNKREIKDFTDYWIPKLKDYKYYKVYPQYSLEIEKMIILDFSLEPKNIFRLFYYIVGSDSNDVEILEPTIKTGIREDFYVMEWGVILP